MTASSAGSCHSGAFPDFFADAFGAVAVDVEATGAASSTKKSCAQKMFELHCGRKRGLETYLIVCYFLQIILRALCLPQCRSIDLLRCKGKELCFQS